MNGKTLFAGASLVLMSAVVGCAVTFEEFPAGLTGGGTGTGGATTTSSSSGGSSTPIGDPGTCPGASVTIDPGETLPVINGDTTGHTSKFVGAKGSEDPSCADCCSASADYKGPDLVYAITPSASGTLVIAWDPTYQDPQIRVRTACAGSVATEVACKWSYTPGTLSISVHVDGGTAYYISAGTWNPDPPDPPTDTYQGPFSLKISLKEKVYPGLP